MFYLIPLFRYLVGKKVIYANKKLYFLSAGSFKSCVYEKAIGSIAFLFLRYMNILLILAIKRALKMKMKRFSFLLLIVSLLKIKIIYINANLRMQGL